MLSLTSTTGHGRPPPVAAATCRAGAARRPCPAAALRRSRPAAAAAAQQRRRAAGVLVCTAAAASVDIEAARKLLDGTTVILDIRPAREYDDGHITKPVKRSASVPFAAGQDGGSFVAAVSAKFSTAAKLIVMCGEGGRNSAEAAELLAVAGFSEVSRMEGGYAAYCEVWSPSGKRRPPAGRWVSTGKEALKSGLNIPGVAESYDEGGNLVNARWAKGLGTGESLPPSS